MKIVPTDQTLPWALGHLSEDGRYLTINAPQSYDAVDQTYESAGLKKGLQDTINRWFISQQIKGLSWTWSGYPLIPKVFDKNQPDSKDGSEGVLGVNIFIYNNTTKKILDDEKIYNSLADFIDDALPKGPFSLIDDDNERISGLRRVPQADMGRFLPPALYQGQIALWDSSEEGHKLFQTIVDPNFFDGDYNPPTATDNKYKTRAYIRIINTTISANISVRFLFVPSIIAMLYEWPDNGGTMVLIAPPFLDDDGAAVEAAPDNNEDPVPADALDELIVEIEPDEGDRAFYWIDDKGELCAAAFRPSASGGGGRGLGQSRSDLITDSDNYWKGPFSLGYALGFDLSRHQDDKEFDKTQAVAATEAAAKKAVGVSKRAAAASSAANDKAAAAAQAAAASPTPAAREAAAWAAAVAKQAADRAAAAKRTATSQIAQMKRTGWFEAETSRKAKAEQGTTYRGQGVGQTTMDSQIRYLKNFDRKTPASRKNFPKSSIPYEAMATESTFSRFSRLFKTLENSSAELRTQKMKTLKIKALPVAAGEPFRPEGVDLKPNPDKRLAAASVMGPAIRGIVESMQLQALVDKNKASVKLGKKSASATAVTKYALGAINKDQVLQDSWKETSSLLLKFGDPVKGVPVSHASDTLKAALRTQQEWCHLWGHGDGGSEIPQNFVAGSKHCNTEQLAIETGRRTRSGDMKGKITAYLLPQVVRSKKIIPSDALKNIRNFGGYLSQCNFEDILNIYLLSLKLYNDMKIVLANSINQGNDNNTKAAIGKSIKEKVEVALATPQNAIFTEKTAIKKADLLNDPRKSLSNFLEWLTPLVTPQLPCAMIIRYKIYQGKTLLFDHVFDAQKESFDFNEFQALATTVERVVAKGPNDYANGINRKIYDRLRDQSADSKTVRQAIAQAAQSDATSAKYFGDAFSMQPGKYPDPAAIELIITNTATAAKKLSAAWPAIKAKQLAPGATATGGDQIGDAFAAVAKLTPYKYEK